MQEEEEEKLGFEGLIRDKLVDFHGVKLFQHECEIMERIEQSLGVILPISEYNLHGFGSHSHVVTKLAFNKKGERGQTAFPFKKKRSILRTEF